MRLNPRVWNILMGVFYGPIIIIILINIFSFETMERLRAIPGIISFTGLYAIFLLLFLGAYVFKDKEGYVPLKVLIRGGIFMIFLALFYDTFFGGGIVEYLLSFIF